VLRIPPSLPVFIAAVTVVALELVHGAAHAEPGGVAHTEADRNRARDLMREGNELYGEGQLAEAYEKYRQAWRSAQSFDIACNLGGTASVLSMNRDAAEYLDYCLRHYAASSRPEAVAAEQRARAAFEVVRSKVAAVNVRVTPAGAEVFVDGASVGRAPLEAAVFVEAGPHRFEARQAGLETAVVDLNAKRGETVEASLELVTASGAPAPAEDPEQGAKDAPNSPPSDAPRKNYVPAIVTTSVGGLALAGGVVFLIVRSGKQSDASKALGAIEGKNPCGEGTPHAAECGEVSELSDQAATFGTLSLASFGVAAGAGVATYLLWPKDAGVTGFHSVRPNVAASHSGVFASVSGAF
jgi:hypothetical protein